MKTISDYFAGIALGRLLAILTVFSLSLAFIFVLFISTLTQIPVYLLAAMCAAFIILYFLLRFFIVSPVSRLSRATRSIGNVVSGPIWSLELNQLTKHFNNQFEQLDDHTSKLEALAIYDPLTGLYNRRKFYDLMRKEFIRASRHGRGFSVIQLGLDDFSLINDTYGHTVGDMVLKEITALLEVELRRVDVLARLGGDEFAIILPETDVARGFRVASKLHKVLAGRVLELPAGKIKVVASFGMVSFPEDGRTEEQFYAAMDAVLSKAKAQGNNQVITAESGGGRSMKIIFKQGDFLRNALRENRIEAFLQPIVNVRTGELVAYEVLGRIRDGEKVVAAQEFAEVAEELGMAHELDREVFRKGLAHYTVIANSHPNVKMFFNLFPSSFMDIEWVRGIPDLVRGAGVPCESIVLEITEREALPNLTQVAEVIEELRAAHISVALDDFGSGFSSFMYLKHLAIDYVKIEGSFIRQIVTDKRDRIMVEHINDMAHQFGLKTVAEFVEDEKTAKVLSEIGVDYAQGYHYGLPELPGYISGGN